MIKTKHIFLLSRIIDKMELDDDIKAIMSMGKGKKKINEAELGYKLIMAIGKKLHLAESEVVTLLSEVFGKERKAIEDQPPKETITMVKDLLSEEGVLDFLHSQQAGLK